MHHIQVRRPPGSLCPVDHAGDPIAFPQNVSWMKVAVHQALSAWRWLLTEERDRPLPKPGPRGPGRHLEIIWYPEHVRPWPMIIIHRCAVNDNGDLGQFIDRFQA